MANNIEGIFNYQDNTYIGEFINETSGKTSLSNQIKGICGDGNFTNVIYVRRPAKIDFRLEKVTVSSTTSYEWKWTITPLLPEVCVGNNNDFNVFAFPKDRVSICCLKLTNLNSNIYNSYKAVFAKS